MKKIIYYISGHGFGHAIRSIEVINALKKRSPQSNIIIRSNVPGFIFKQNLKVNITMSPIKLDIGLHQLDSINFDLEATLTDLSLFFNQMDRLIEQEKNFIKQEKASAIICDIPFLPFGSAAERSISSIGISNFSWDWIYGAFIKKDLLWNQFIEKIKLFYQKADLFLRLPFHGDMSIFPQIKDIPLIARKSKYKPIDIRNHLGLPLDKKIILITFNKLNLTDKALKRLDSYKDQKFVFVSCSPLCFKLKNLILIKLQGLRYHDLINCVEAVITKPGYGIVTDCIANQTPIIYTDRGEFPEYPILVKGIKKYIPSIYMPSQELYAGRWEPYIKQILYPFEKDSFPGIKTNGADVAASEILDFI